MPTNLDSARATTTPFEYTTETKIEIAFGEDAPRMKEIAMCESGMRQFDANGNTITSPTNDHGLFQINEATWEGVANEMGLDYKNSEEDNIRMAQHILWTSGMDAWVCNGII